MRASRAACLCALVLALGLACDPAHSLAQDLRPDEAIELESEPSESEPSESEPSEDEATEDGPARLWQDRWGRSGMPNYALIGGGALLAVSNIILGSGRARFNRGRNPFDEAARDALRVPVEQARLVVRDFSDGLLTLMTSLPILFEAVVIAAWQRQEEDTAIEMTLMHIEVISTTLALQTLANVVVSRERPYGRTCGGPLEDDLPGDSSFCRTPDRYYSFFSGHTSQAFASAAVMCSFHLNMPLLSDGPENTLLPCVGGFVLAGATGLLRVLGDQHYLSDVLTGAAMGTAIGFLLPWALHFGHDDRPRGGGAPDVSVSLVPTGNGAALIGVF